MTKPAITKRSVKGAALTYSELDTNFQNLADASLSMTAGSGGTAVTADLNGNITLVAGTGITLSGNNTAKTITITGSTTGLTDIVQDTSPQLGNDLDVNGFKIVSTSNGNIVLEPNGTGDVYLTSDTIVIGDGAISQVDITAISGSSIVLRSGNGVGAQIVLTYGTNGSIDLIPSGAGKVNVTTSLEVGYNGTITAVDTIGHSFFSKRTSTSINTTFDTAVILDNIQARVHGMGGSAGQLQIAAHDSTFTAYVSTVGNIAGSAIAADTSSSGITFTVGGWTSCNFRYNISAGGDVIEAHVLDYTNDRAYRITAIHGNNTTGAFVSIERML